MGSVGVEWCAGTSPFARAALREGRNCVSFERDESIIEAVKLALAQTMKSVVTSLGQRVDRIGNVFEQHLLGHQVAQCVTLAVAAVEVKGELRVTLKLYM
jgi:hypothetical protein